MGQASFVNVCDACARKKEFAMRPKQVYHKAATTYYNIHPGRGVMLADFGILKASGQFLGFRGNQALERTAHSIKTTDNNPWWHAVEGTAFPLARRDLAVRASQV